MCNMREDVQYKQGCAAQIRHIYVQHNLLTGNLNQDVYNGKFSYVNHEFIVTTVRK